MAFSVMSNHFHCVLRTRPDIVKEWSDDQVARRWWKLFPKRRDETGAPADPTELEIRSLVADTERLAELRKRLSRNHDNRYRAHSSDDHLGKLRTTTKQYRWPECETKRHEKSPKPLAHQSQSTTVLANWWMAELGSQIVWRSYGSTSCPSAQRLKYRPTA